MFLDVDGVLSIREQGGGLQSELCSNLLNAIKGLDVTIVLTSDWKHSEDRISILKEHGIVIAGVTEDVAGEPRGRGIAKWLDDHQAEISTGARIAVLDDLSTANPLALPDYKYKETTRFFQTIPHETISSTPGLTQKLKDRIKIHLST